MDRDVLLKKNIIGGFDKKQVMDYISHLQASCNNRKTREEIEDMRLRVASLREVIKEKDKQIAALTSEIDDINNVKLPGSETKSGFDILKVSAEQFEKAKIEGEEITAKVSEGIKSKEDKFSTLFNRISSINDEISKFSESISGLSEKLEDVPFVPITEKDIEAHEMPKFDFDKVMEAIAEEEAQLAAEAEARAKAEYEERKRIESEIRAKLEAEAAEKSRLEAEARAKAEAEKKAKLEAEAKAKAEAEEKARLEAEAKDEAEKIKLEAEAKAKEIAEEKAKLEAEAAELAKAKSDNQDEKFNTLFARLTAMTDEINKMHGSISDVSEKLNKMPENNSQASDEDSEKTDTPAEISAPEAPIVENNTAVDSDTADDNLYDDMFTEIETVINGMSADDELIKTAVDNAAEKETLKFNEKEAPKADSKPASEEPAPVAESEQPAEPATAPSIPVVSVAVPVEEPIAEPEEQTIQIDIEPQKQPTEEKIPTQAEIIAEEEKKIEKIRAEKEKLEKTLAEKKAQSTPEKKEENKVSKASSNEAVEEELYFTFDL